MVKGTQKAPEAITPEAQTVQTETKDITLENWEGLTEDQKTTLKEALLKSLYGVGGEHLSTFPTLLDNKINTWVEDKYKVSKLPKRIQETTLQEWKANGEIKILMVEKGGKDYHLVLFLPAKETKMDLWELAKEDKKPYLEYTTHKALKAVKLGKEHFHLLNLYTNKNKAYNQSRALVKLLKAYGDNKELEAQKEGNRNFLKMEIGENGKYQFLEIGGNSKQPTGKSFSTIGEYLGRSQHKDIKINFTEAIQTL